MVCRLKRSGQVRSNSKYNRTLVLAGTGVLAQRRSRHGCSLKLPPAAVSAAVLLRLRLQLLRLQLLLARAVGRLRPTTIWSPRPTTATLSAVISLAIPQSHRADTSRPPLARRLLEWRCSRHLLNLVHVGRRHTLDGSSPCGEPIAAALATAALASALATASIASALATASIASALATASIASALSSTLTSAAVAAAHSAAVAATTFAAAHPSAVVLQRLHLSRVRCEQRRRVRRRRCGQRVQHVRRGPRL